MITVNAKLLLILSGDQLQINRILTDYPTHTTETPIPFEILQGQTEICLFQNRNLVIEKLHDIYYLGQAEPNTFEMKELDLPEDVDLSKCRVYISHIDGIYFKHIE